MQPSCKHSRSSYSFPDWECAEGFLPLAAKPPAPKWVTHDLAQIELAQGMAKDNSHISQKFVEDIVSGNKSADVSLLTFRDPDTFLAGNLHNHAHSWDIQRQVETNRAIHSKPVKTNGKEMFNFRCLLNQYQGKMNSY